MKLIPEQIIQIKKKIGELEKRVENYNDYYADRNTTGAAKSPGNQYGDFFTEHGLDLEFFKLKKYREIIMGSEFVYERDYETVNCGTKFQYCFVDEPTEIEEGMLADSMIGLASHKGFISSSSKLGEAVLGKQVGSVCIYKGVEDFQVIRITGIESNRYNYVNFIRSIPYNIRKCKQSRMEMIMEKEENPDCYLRRKEITVSQLELLKEELERITNCINVKNITKIKRRISEIKGYLKNREIAETCLDGTIGVGTKFKITFLNRDGSMITKELEMINVALGDELDSDYVERISRLGVAIYGLREGDTFSYNFKGVGNVSGYVHDIQTQKLNKASEKNIQYIK